MSFQRPVCLSLFKNRPGGSCFRHSWTMDMATRGFSKRFPETYSTFRSSTILRYRLFPGWWFVPPVLKAKLRVRNSACIEALTSPSAQDIVRMRSINASNGPITKIFVQVIHMCDCRWVCFGCLRGFCFGLTVLVFPKISSSQSKEAPH